MQNESPIFAMQPSAQSRNIAKKLIKNVTGLSKAYKYLYRQNNPISCDLTVQGLSD